MAAILRGVIFPTSLSMSAESGKMNSGERLMCGAAFARHTLAAESQAGCGRYRKRQRSEQRPGYDKYNQRDARRAGERSGRRRYSPDAVVQGDKVLLRTRKRIGKVG